MPRGTSSHWSIRYRHPLAGLRTSAWVGAVAGITLALEVLVVLGTGTRITQDGVLDAAITTAALLLAPPVTAAAAVLVLRRSTPTYRQLATETCVGVLICDLVIALALLRG